MQAHTSRELIECRKLTSFFTYTDNYTRSCELTLCRGTQCTYISQNVVVKNISLQQKYMFLPKTQKLIRLAKCLSSVCPIVLVKCSGYTRMILCYVSAGENRKMKPAFTKYGAKHTEGSSNRILLPSMSEMPG